jgi:tripartite-type tricarboxylate transporter receptor subunit TctC
MTTRPSARALVRVAAMAMVAVSCSIGAAAEQYPTRPIEMIVPWGPGGGADQTGRMIAKLLEQDLKVSFPVENIPGGTGVTGLNKLLNGQPEGYQIALLTADTLLLLAAPRAQRWKLDDLAPIAVLIKQPSGFFAKADGPLQTWADVEAKAKTTELKVGVTGLGTPDELAVEQMKKRGLKLVAVPFVRPGERYAAVIGGHADLVYEQAGDIRSFIDNKQLRPLLFLAREKVEPFADTPTTKDLGIDLVLDQFRTVVARAGTPPDRLKLLQERVAKVGDGNDYAAFLAGGWADPKSVIVGDKAKAYIEDQITALRKIWQ